jgi:hypothetical protein
MEQVERSPVARRFGLAAVMPDPSIDKRWLVSAIRQIARPRRRRRDAVKEVGAGSLSCDLAVGLGRSLNFVDWHDDETSSRTPDNNSKLMVR